jgi:hypothetical protein
MKVARAPFAYWSPLSFILGAALTWIIHEIRGQNA